MSKLGDFIKRKKGVFITILAIMITAGWLGYGQVRSAENGVRYVTEAAERGLLISSISGTGQISALEQVEIKPKVSGELVYLGVKNGQRVGAGQIIARIDNRDAIRKVSEAQTSLETARLELEELLEPTDDYTLLQAENALTDTKEALTKLMLEQTQEQEEILEDKEKARDNLRKSYEEGFNQVVEAFLQLPEIMAGLKDILYSSDFSIYQWNVDYYSNIKNSLEAGEKSGKQTKKRYQEARSKYETNLLNYKNASRYSDEETVRGLIIETYETTKTINEAAKEAKNLVDLYKDDMAKRGLTAPSPTATHQTNLESHINKTNSQLINLLNIKRTIEDSESAIKNCDKELLNAKRDNPLAREQAERGIKEKEQRLVDLKAGPTELEIRNKKINIQQKEYSLLEAEQDLADYYVRAPFGGMVASVEVTRGDSVGTGTIIATLITSQKVAIITLNEIDAALVEVGQKTTLDFDAIPDLGLTGEVMEVETLGTVTQGVVSYDIKIAFDVEDERIKPGMTVSASIITEAKSEVLLVPLGAVKTVDDYSYVEILVNEQVQNRAVSLGASNDTMIEIVSGLEEGEEVITETLGSGTRRVQTIGTQERQRREAMQGMMRIMR